MKRIKISVLLFLMSSIFILPTEEVDEISDKDPLKEYVSDIITELKDLKCMASSKTNITSLLKQSVELNNCKRDKDEIENTNKKLLLKVTDIETKYKLCLNQTSRCSTENNSNLSTTVTALKLQIKGKDQTISNLTKEVTNLKRQLSTAYRRNFKTLKVASRGSRSRQRHNRRPQTTVQAF